MDNYSLQKPLNMAPTGIATFAKSDLATDIYHLNADVAVLGAPFDLAIQGPHGLPSWPSRNPVGFNPLYLQKGRAPMIRNASSTIWMPDVGML